jgi:hypothetical protein
VERAAQREPSFLHGWHFLPGFYLSPPVPAKELFTLLAASSVPAESVAADRFRPNAAPRRRWAFAADD